MPGSFPGCLNAAPRSDSHTRSFPLDFSLPDSLFAAGDTICSACSDRSVTETLLSILFQYQTTAGLFSRETYTLKLFTDPHSSRDGHIHSYSCVCRSVFMQVDSSDMGHVPHGWTLTWRPEYSVHSLSLRHGTFWLVCVCHVWSGW